MKSDRLLLNDISGVNSVLHKLSDDESRALKKTLINILTDISTLCNEYNLTFMLGGGSCLGAIRHRGFIPWDDDLDIMMPRKDYNKLIKLCENGFLGDRYEFTYPSPIKDSKNTFLKIYRKGTLNLELHCENTPFPNGIYIDIFPMEAAPKIRIIQQIKGLVSFLLQLICTSVLYTEYPSEKYRKYIQNNKKAYRRYLCRLVIGHIFGIIPHRKWVWWFDKYNSSSEDTGFTTIPTGRKRYTGELLPNNIFYPVKYIEFESTIIPVPNDYDKYLTNLYGKYMEIPPESERERHFVYKFNCDLSI